MKIGGKHLHTPIRYLFLEAVAELMGLMSGFGIFLADLIISYVSSDVKKVWGYYG